MSYGMHEIDGTLVELCTECGFDGRRCEPDETPALAAAFGRVDALLDHPDATRKPGPEVWSAQEYAEHTVEVTEALLGYVGQVLGRPTPTGLRTLADCTAACTAVVPALSPEDRGQILYDVYSVPVTLSWVVRHLLHDTEHHVLDVRRNYAAFARADHPQAGGKSRG